MFLFFIWLVFASQNCAKKERSMQLSLQRSASSVEVCTVYEEEDDDDDDDERLQKSGLTTLETKRLRGDLIEMFKLFKGIMISNYISHKSIWML